MENDTLLWVEKYRPQTLDTYVGNEHLVKKVGSYIKNDDLARTSVENLMIFESIVSLKIKRGLLESSKAGSDGNKISSQTISRDARAESKVSY